MNAKRWVAIAVVVLAVAGFGLRLAMLRQQNRIMDEIEAEGPRPWPHAVAPSEKLEARIAGLEERLNRLTISAAAFSEAARANASGLLDLAKQASARQKELEREVESLKLKVAELSTQAKTRQTARAR